MRGAIFAAALVLAVLHHDVWFFHDSRLVFGFVPIGLFWHALYSVLAALLWWVAIRHAWPTELIRLAEDDPIEPDAAGGEGASA